MAMSVLLSNVEKLRRFMYTNATDGTYITGNPDPFYDGVDLEFLFNMSLNENADFVAVLATCNSDKHLPRRQNLFYVLAYVLRSIGFGRKEVKDCEEAKVTKALVLNFAKNDAEFFDYIKYYTILNKTSMHSPKISTSLKKLIIEFYNRKSPRDLVYSVTEFKGMHGWTHKDLIKLVHYKPLQPCSEFIVTYVLRGIDAINNIDRPDFEWALKVMKRCHELRTTMDAERAASMIKTVRASISLVNSKLNKNQKVWAALIPQTPLQELFKYLYKFYKLKWLIADCPISQLCYEALNDPVRIAESDINPLQVYCTLLNFSRGGKSLDPKYTKYLTSSKRFTDKKNLKYDEPKLPTMMQNLNNCLVSSYFNVRPTNKRFLITIDVNAPEEICFHNRLIKSIEATYSIVRYFKKVEKKVTIAAFQTNKIAIIDLDNKVKTSQDWIGKFQEYKCDYINPATPFDWAIENQKVFDVFINILSVNWKTKVPSPEKDNLIPEWEALDEYRSEMKSQKTKLIRIFPGGHKTLIGTGEKDTLNISGFTGDVHKVLDAFITDRFH